MNTIKTNTELSFQGAESKINRFATSILQTTFFGMLLAVFIIFVLGPAYGIWKRGIDAMLLVALLCWGISLLILIPAIRYYIIKRKSLASKITVDHTGLFWYNSKNEIVEQILYTELHPSKQNFDLNTVTTVGGSLVPLLELTVKRDKIEEEVTQRIDMNLPLYVVKNKSTLYAHFMQGIAIFRPDLKINPVALKSFSIDPDTWKVKGKGISWGGWLLILTALILTGILISIPFLFFKIEN
ncbi:hypothetical protein [Chryseobacterium pennipullorum]|uniref:Uncharacterized protein n=1 Tax=Chryseobacterium pennipullorum TaxID=2258963 RepID=A0A3D9B257_9FLAO|nr:hypothetical protein [Chryseobacterium pennipullorum]REC47730.1 hypothetical protein DRF67_09715 [Chryseobacterium pennipullorum]